MTFADTFNLRAPSTVKMNDVASAADGVISRMSGGNGTGSANIHAITLSPAPAAYSEITGTPISFFPVATNTGASTLNVNSLGTRTIRYKNQALRGGELVLSNPVVVVYDGTFFQLVNHGGGWASWTPTFSTENGAHWTPVTVIRAEYQQHGNEIRFYINASGTVITTSPRELRFSLPILAANTDSRGGGSIYDGATTFSAYWGLVSTTVAIVCNNNTSLLGTGASRQIQVQGFYKT